ncbi:MAG: radical SAM protein [Deltaproteobacteria bacterium]|nr:radical SAM protein [Deltaproteobacteria bacterium]
MELFLTHDCNLRCRYCYNGRHFKRVMPRRVMEAAVSLAFDRGEGPVTVSFFGGEPLMEFHRLKDGVALSRAASKRSGREVRFQVTTNGTLLSGRRLEYLVAGGVSLNVSLDGNRAVQDRRRPFRNGKGSHRRVVENLLRARVVAGKVTVTMVAGPGHLAELPASLAHILSLGVETVHLALDYHADWSAGDVEALGVALEVVGNCWVDAYRRGRPFSLPVFDSKIARHVLQPLVNFPRCACGDREWTVAPSGRIYPCDRMVGDDDGNGPVIGDVFAGFDAEATARFLGCHQGTPDRCRDCDDSPRCLFWASCVKYGLTGNVGEPPDILCRLERTVIRAADRAAAILFEEGNATFIRRFYQGHYARRVLHALGLKTGDVDQR